MCDTADLIHTEASERARKAEAHAWISANPIDVENWANLSIGFDDGTRASVVINDTGLGGLNTRVITFMTDGVIKANMTQNDTLETYSPNATNFGEEYFTEKLETRAGWNRPSCDEDWFRGLSLEISDFVSAIRSGKQPLSGIDLAVACVEVIYAAYVSSEQGQRVSLV
jgi:predicted dehydrogenase